MSLGAIHLLRPLWLLALLGLPLLLLAMRRAQARLTPWRRACDPSLLPHVLARSPGVDGRSRRQRLLGALALAYLIAVLALAGPAWKQLPQPLYRDLSALVIALDLSRSMDATDISPSRLARARFKIADILRARQAGLTAMVVYADDAYGVVPLTDDVATVIIQLPVLESELMPAQGSRPERAVRKALELFEQAEIPRGDLLLVTDGVTPAQADSIAAMLRGTAYRLSVLGVGTERGVALQSPSGEPFVDGSGPVYSRLESAGLQTLAQRGRGLYQRVAIDDRDVEALDRFFTVRIHAGAAATRDLQTERWREEGPWLVLALLPLAALAFRRGVIVALFVVLLPWPRQATAAGSWTDLWQRPEQQAADALARGDAEAAALLFKDRRWQAAARYRASDYAGALQALRGLETATDHYNRGNALARLGQYQDAIAAYNRTLALAPEDRDARHNRNLLQRLLEGGAAGSSGPASAGGGEESASRAGKQGAEGAQDPASRGERQSSARGRDSQPSPATPGSEESESKAAKEGDARESHGRAQDESDKPASAAGTPGEREQSREMAQADEQWLRRIPDDPGGLLRRKFYLQYRQHRADEANAQPW
ncbi:MAG: VWA domain-containing protein [Chromatiales bacterium]